MQPSCQLHKGDPQRGFPGSPLTLSIAHLGGEGGGPVGYAEPLLAARFSRLRPPRQGVLARAVPGDGPPRALRSTLTGPRPPAQALPRKEAVRAEVFAKTPADSGGQNTS